MNTIRKRDLLTTREAAEVAGVARITILRAIAEGRLRAHKTAGGPWLIDTRDLREYHPAPPFGGRPRHR